MGRLLELKQTTKKNLNIELVFEGGHGEAEGFKYSDKIKLSVIFKPKIQ